MSARRYSGDLTITLTYRDREDDYRATVSWNAGTVGDVRRRGRSSFAQKRHVVYVGRLPTQSADSPATFDSVAHAAISFADDEDPHSHIGNYAALTDSGWHVARSKARAWGGEKVEKVNRALRRMEVRTGRSRP